MYKCIIKSTLLSFLDPFFNLLREYPMIKKLIVLGSILLGFNAYAAPMDVDQDFDSRRYLGKWYEIARVPNPFQEKCEKNISALYELNQDGLSVLNSCELSNGEYTEAIGQAYLANENGSKLKVSFLPKYLRWIPFTKGDYWILRLDSEYEVSLVGDPEKKYLWLLARNPNLEQSVMNDYLEYAADYGYKNLDQLIYSKHD